MTHRDLEALQRAADAGEPLEYVLFWGHTGGPGLGPHCLSQWYPATFTVDGDAYASTEHWMMAEKARLFADDEIRARVLAAETPAEAKKLGRAVRNFDGDVWTRHREDIVAAGNRHKFGQHEDLRAYLLGTGARVLVEASPVDLIWGIGFAASAPEARDPRAWRGLNLLGFALMRVRDALR